MKFTLSMSNDAVLHNAPISESARILREIASRLEAGEATGKFQTIFDVNGNDVGRWRLSSREES